MDADDADAGEDGRLGAEASRRAIDPEPDGDGGDDEPDDDEESDDDDNPDEEPPDSDDNEPDDDEPDDDEPDDDAPDDDEPDDGSDDDVPDEDAAEVSAAYRALPDPVGSKVVPARCPRCGAALDGEFYEADGDPVCAACADALRHGPGGEPERARVLRALLFGALAGGGAALLWAAVRAASGYQIPMLALAVGPAVGAAVRLGGRARGGHLYRAVAMVITYLAIVSTHVPELMDALTAPADPGVAPMPVFTAFATACLFAPFVPFFSGVKGLLGLAYIAFTLLVAWRLNGRAVREVRGPFPVARAEA